MALEATFKKDLENTPFFRDNPVAWKIVHDGIQLLSPGKPLVYNMQALLSNMCAYGAKQWSYEPGSPAKADHTLRGTSNVTDCGSLATMFCKIANALFDCGATPKEIKREGYRIVTKPGICTFKGKPGDRSLEGRWCFGNHWVAEVAGICYDPTFKFQGFSFGSASTMYLGWYAKETANTNCFTKTFWKADPGVPGSKDIYMRMVPDVSYTFKRTDVRTGREV